MILLLLLGCPKKAAPPPEELEFSWEDPPHLPSPTAGTYSVARSQPKDIGLRLTLGSHPWDEALAGAATAVGLDITRSEGGLTAPELREAAWRAGWPYPIRSAHVWLGGLGRPAPLQVAQWLAVEPDPVGLVRVRGGMQDVWVGVASRVRVDLGTLPRQLAVDAVLTLPAVPGATATLADPYGTLLGGELHVPWSTTVGTAGEWLVEIRDADGVLAAFPIYVGMVPPDLDLLVPTDPPTDPDALAADALDQLAAVRGAYGYPPCERDPILDAFVRTDATAEAMAAKAGMARDRIWRWECTGPSVEDCLDDIVWDVRARPGLLAPDTLCGVTASEGPEVHVRFVVGAP